MATICIHSGWSNETDEEFLDRIIDQAPGSEPRWGNVRAIRNSEDADYHIAFNRLPSDPEPTRLLLFCAEPPPIGACEGWGGVDALATFPLSRHHKPQRWWIDRSYDELSELEPPEKHRNLSWITTDKGRGVNVAVRTLRRLAGVFSDSRYGHTGVGMLDRDLTSGHILRMRFLDRLTRSYGNHLDLYGRGDFSGPWYRGPVDDKWTGLVDHRYSLAIENYRGPNYFSEKLADALLAWCMPIYWGCTNLDDYLPTDSFVEIDITDDDAPERVAEVASSDRRERNLEAIAEARRLILDEYQIWPTVADAVEAVEET